METGLAGPKALKEEGAVFFSRYSARRLFNGGHKWGANNALSRIIREKEKERGDLFSPQAKELQIMGRRTLDKWSWQKSRDFCDFLFLT